MLNPRTCNLAKPAWNLLKELTALGARQVRYVPWYIFFLKKEINVYLQFSFKKGFLIHDSLLPSYLHHRIDTRKRFGVFTTFRRNWTSSLTRLKRLWLTSQHSLLGSTTVVGRIQRIRMQSIGATVTAILFIQTQQIIWLAIMVDCCLG